MFQQRKEMHRFLNLGLCHADFSTSRCDDIIQQCPRHYVHGATIETAYMTIQNYLYFFPLKPCTKQNLSAFNLLQLHWGDVRLQFIYLFEDLNPPHQSPPRKPIRLLMSRLELAKTGT